MGKTNKSSESEKVAKKSNLAVKITKRFKASFSTYESKAYCHLNDGIKKKYISFDLEVAKKIAKKMPKILDRLQAEQEKAASHSDSSDSSSDSD